MKKIFTLLLLMAAATSAFSQAPALQWQKCLGGTGYDEASSIQQTSDGGYIVAGYSLSTDGDVSGNHGGGDYWVVKLGPDPTAVSNVSTTIGLSLRPNPATTEILLQSKEAMRAVLITDISGKEVYQSEVSGNKVSVPTATLPNGLYFVRVQTANGLAVQRFLVQR